MQRRFLAAALAFSMLMTFPFVPGGTVAADATGKYDQALALALAGDPAYARWADAQGRFEVLISGPAHGVPDVMPSARTGWQNYWGDSAAPFFAQLRGALRHGDELVLELPVAPMAKVKATPARIAELAQLDTVRGLGLDWPHAVQLLDAPGEGPGVSMGQSVGMTGVFGVHNLGFLGQGVRLAMVDTGIEHTHSMFLDEFGNSRVTDFYDSTASGCTTHCDTNGHGTHTASTAAGSNLAGGRYQGVAPRAEIIDVKIFIGSSGSWEDAHEGLNLAFNSGADITSNSWGGGCGGVGSGGYIAEQIAQQTALAGQQHVFAAGNSGANSAGGLCPGRNDYVIAVASTEKNKVISGFSSGGPCPDGNGGNTRICPDVSAVGGNVDAAWIGGGYNAISGTSMATPHVAGGAVLMYQMAKALRNQVYNVPSQSLEQFFEAHAEDLGPLGNDNRYGWGFIRLGQMGDVQLPGALARATIDVSVAKAEMRNRDTNTVTVTLRNLGPTTVTGTWKVVAGGELEHDGAEYGSGAVSLAPGQTRTEQVTIPGADLDPTKYHVIGTLDYQWTLLGDTVRATVEDLNSFIVRGVKMSIARSSTPNFFGANGVWAGNATTVVLTLRNVGNEPATNVDLIEGVPLLGYAFEPRSTANANNPLTVVSSPAPTSFEVDAEGKTFDLSYAPSAVNPGTPYNVAYKLRAAAPGAYDFVGFVTFTDAVGDEFEQTITQTGIVHCPGVKANPVSVPSAC